MVGIALGVLGILHFFVAEQLAVGIDLDVLGLFLIFGAGQVVAGIALGVVGVLHIFRIEQLLVGFVLGVLGLFLAFGAEQVAVGTAVSAIGYSLVLGIEQKGKRGAAARVLSRAVVLYALGIFMYGGFSGSFQHIRLLGVLQRIALAYLFAGLIFVFLGLRGRIAWCMGLLIGYWALMAFVPVPDGKAGDFAEGANLANWIDANYLPLRKWDGNHDPEGLLSTLPAIANCLIGVFAGMLLRNGKQVPWQKALLLAIAGGVMLGLGSAWGTQFTRPPAIEKIWDVIYFTGDQRDLDLIGHLYFVACGYASLLLAAFYVVIDVISWTALGRCLSSGSA